MHFRNRNLGCLVLGSEVRNAGCWTSELSNFLGTRTHTRSPRRHQHIVAAGSKIVLKQTCFVELGPYYDSILASQLLYAITMKKKDSSGHLLEVKQLCASLKLEAFQDLCTWIHTTHSAVNACLQTFRQPSIPEGPFMQPQSSQSSTVKALSLILLTFMLPFLPSACR